MKSLKRLFCITIVVTVIISMLSTLSISIAASSSSDFEVQGSVLIKYNGTDANVVIPGDLGITKISDLSIGNGAFTDNENIVSVIIPSGVTEIRDWSFTFCNNLASVYIPDGVTRIGMYAFEECAITSLRLPDNPIFFDERSFTGCKATSIIIPEGSSIGVRTFSGCTGLTSITIPGSIKFLPLAVFDGCSNLTTVVIKNGATSIGVSAFDGCKSLASIEIPSSVKEIGDTAFEDCNESLIIYGEDGSYAQEYALLHFIPFIIGEAPMPTSTSTATPAVTTTATPSPSPDVTSTPEITLTPTLTPTPTSTPDITFTPTPTLTPTSTPVPTFSDVGRDLAEGWATDYILSLASLGVINGYDNGTYRPENPITRAEFIKVLTVAFCVYDKNATINNFSDVLPTDWFYTYVASGVNEELANPNGLGDGTFGAETYMSREQMVTFSARALKKYKGYNYPDEQATTAKLAMFSDASEISDYARTSVALCADKGILNGYTESNVTTFKPGNNINRAEVAKITDMVLKLEDLRK